MGRRKVTVGNECRIPLRAMPSTATTCECQPYWAIVEESSTRAGQPLTRLSLALRPYGLRSHRAPRTSLVRWRRWHNQLRSSHPIPVFRALLGANTNVPTVGRVACTVVLLSAICSGTDHRLGPTAGAGIEYGITSAISAKFEHLYIVAVSLVVSRIKEV